MKDENLWEKWCAELWKTPLDDIFKADLPTRYKSIVSVLST